MPAGARWASLTTPPDAEMFYPVLQRLGLLWAENVLHPAKEHFVTNLFRQKILSAIDGLPPPATSKDTWMLFLPENEFHDMGLLFSSFLIRQAGNKVIYLGENMPLDSLKLAVAEVRPSRLLIFLSSEHKEKETISKKGIYAVL
jgi:methanogenic corrinoid protein MtbC1